MLRSVPFVPLYYAETIGEPKQSGASVPLTLGCIYRTEDGDEQRDEFVVKFFADLPLNVKGLARELVASLLGQTLGLNIPKVGFVYISDALCSAAQASHWHDKICKSMGINFGSLLVPNPIEDREIPKSHLDAATEVFAFDMLIQNLDRTAQKCNLFRTKSGFILIDHEKSLICGDPSKLLGIVPQPWQFETLNPQNHVCYNALKSEKLNFDSFVERLASLTDQTIDDILARVPTEWASSELGNIRAHLVKARANTEKFKRSLQEVLA